jgi:hypothetical protein
MIYMGVPIASIITLRVVVWWRWMQAGVARDESDAGQRSVGPDANGDI